MRLFFFAIEGRMFMFRCCHGEFVFVRKSRRHHRTIVTTLAVLLRSLLYRLLKIIRNHQSETYRFYVKIKMIFIRIKTSPSFTHR